MNKLAFNTVKKNCPICGSNKTLRIRKKIWDDSAKTVRECTNCFVSFLSPMPTDDEIETIYQDYYKYCIDREPDGKLSSLFAKQEVDVIRQYNSIKPFLKSNYTLCDLGASRGVFLERVRESGLKVVGIELDPIVSKELDRKRIEHYKDIESAKKNNLKFDVVTMFHSVEHLRYPINDLKKIKTILKTNGVIIIETPSSNDPLIKLYNCEAFKEFYYRKEHCYYFSPESLNRMCEFAGLMNIKTILAQRYGIDNHLGWISFGKSGGNKELCKIFGSIDNNYREALIKNNFSDTFISVFKK